MITWLIIIIFKREAALWNPVVFKREAAFYGILCF